MTAGTVSSSSALCTLTVAQSSLDQDLLLQLVLKLASPLQVKVKAVKQSGSMQLQLGPHAHDNLLHQRGAVLRALCGMGLHCALDQKYRLLGGHGSAARCSLASRIALASLAEWMTVAQELRASKQLTELLPTAAVLDRLESHLVAHAYLIPSPQATLADLDVAIALLGQPGVLEESWAKRPHTARWLRQCHAELRAFLGAAASKLVAPPPAPVVLPVFYNGTEAAGVAAGAPTTAPKKAESAGASATKPQPPAAPQQKQQPKTDKKANKDGAAAAKKAESSKAPAASAAPPASSEYTVAALDIRVGQITEVWHHESADKLFCETIDLGTEVRKIASGLRPFYRTEDLLGKRVLVLCNLKARNLVGFPSHGMVLCASNDDHTSVELVVPPEGAALGERVIFDGYAGDPEPENKVGKKKIFEAVAPDLKTNEHGIVVWRGAVAKTSAGEVKALNSMPGARVS